MIHATRGSDNVASRRPTLRGPAAAERSGELVRGHGLVQFDEHRDDRVGVELAVRAAGRAVQGRRRRRRRQSSSPASSAARPAARAWGPVRGAAVGGPGGCAGGRRRRVRRATTGKFLLSCPHPAGWAGWCGTGTGGAYGQLSVVHRAPGSPFCRVRHRWWRSSWVRGVTGAIWCSMPDCCGRAGQGASLTLRFRRGRDLGGDTRGR